MNLRRLTVKTTGLALSAFAVAAILSVTASAQLTLDNFPTGNNGKNYDKTLNTPQSSATYYEALPEGSPLGAARGTTFIVGPDPYAQSNTIDIGNGICIVETAFQASSALEIVYGVNTHGKEVPLGLNLGSYSGLQLNFAGLAAPITAVTAIIEVWPSSGGYYISDVLLNSSYYPFTATFPFTSFTGSDGQSGLTPAEASDISYIYIEFQAGYTQSYGITSFQAYN